MPKSANRIGSEPTIVTTPFWRRASSGIWTDFVTPWSVRSPVAVTWTVAPSAGRSPSSIGCGELERRRRELRRLERLAAELAVAPRVVALEGRQVGGELGGGDGRARRR